ncbi:hypothetical protein DH2020_047113 [Rehmannia glutinosa]|uniref:Uncharacterized protein n=1 Tax=Rehmannia glutinosa TaxID=99300 RepID=A0ABR0U996_REHGL
MRSNYEEAVELLKLSLDSCKQLPLPLILFYEELILTLQSKTLHPTIVEWVGKQVVDFELTYLSDLDSGNLVDSDLSYGLEGELWMNLDGDISPICLNILPLVFPLFRVGGKQGAMRMVPILRSTSPLQVERLANQGSLGGIDALLGCPFHLPSSKLNVFSTQVVKECDSISQATKEDIILKLLKRLRNLVFVECLLDNFLKKHPVLLPELYPHWELSPVIQFDYVRDSENMSQSLKGSGRISGNRRRNTGKSSLPSANSNIEEKLRQPTIVDIWRKAGAIPSQEALKEDVSVMSSKTIQSESEGNQAGNSNMPQDIEISGIVKCLEAQKYKFRPLSVDFLSLLACLEVHICLALSALPFLHSCTMSIHDEVDNPCGFLVKFVSSGLV